jgi:fatty-acyl-CoA synthase
MRIHDSFDYHARARGDVIFATQGTRRLTYGEAWEETNRVAHALLEARIGIGDRFAYLSQNSIDAVMAYLAASKVGAVPVPLNWRLAPPEWAYILKDSGAKLVIAQAAYTLGIDAIRSDAPALERFLSIDANAPAGWEDYRSQVDAQPATPPEPERRITPDDVLYQMYTSGTTGRPKGARLSQRGVVANAMQGLAVCPDLVGVGRRGLIVMPLFHAGATSFAFGLAMSGGTLVIHDAFDPAAVVRALSEEDVAAVNFVPAMIQACLTLVPDVAERRYDSLRAVIYGAAPIAEETLRRAVDVFGCGFYQGFGQTESSAVLTFLSDEDHRKALAGRPELLLSAGRPVAGTEIRIVDAKDRELPPGQPGEIVARGPQVMQGYWNLPQETEKALRGGWLHTGDVGVLDEEGYLFLRDRLKDMIVSGGENVYPREVENALFEHPDILDAAAIGVPDPKYGETVMAFVVPRPGATLGAEDVSAHCRAHLAGYKIPRRVEFREALPRNASGKVLKTELRAPFWEGHTRNVG